MPAINPMVSGNFAAAQDLALYKGILQKASGMKSTRMDIFTLMTSVQAQEKFARFSGFGQFGTKPVGGPPQADSAQQMYSKFIRHVTYGKRIDITMEAIQDDPKGIIKRIWQMGRDLAGVWEYTKEQLHWSFMNTHWSATASGAFYNMNGADFPLFSLAHPTANVGQTYRNRFTNAMQLNRATLESALMQMDLNLLNSRGMLQMIAPQTLLVGRQDLPTATRLLADMGVPESADNGPNFIADYLKRIVSPPLFATDGRFAIFGPKDDIGFATFDRMGLETQTLSQNDTLNSTRVAAARVGYGGLFPDGTFGAVPA